MRIFSPIVVKSFLVLIGMVAISSGASADRGQSEQRVVIFGDSIAAGYGVDPQQAFPALLQEKADRAGLSYRFINAGLSGETSAGGLRRINWILRQHVDIFILELGGNDGLRGLDLQQTESNLSQIIKTVKDRYPKARVILAGMEIPPNLGPDYTRRFREIFPSLASKHQIELIPFILAGVGGEQSLNQADGIHPTIEGHRIIASTVWHSLDLK